MDINKALEIIEEAYAGYKSKKGTDNNFCNSFKKLVESHGVKRDTELMTFLETVLDESFFEPKVMPKSWKKDLTRKKGLEGMGIVLNIQAIREYIEKEKGQDVHTQLVETCRTRSNFYHQCHRLVKMDAKISPAESDNDASSEDNEPSAPADAARTAGNNVQVKDIEVAQMLQQVMARLSERQDKMDEEFTKLKELVTLLIRHTNPMAAEMLKRSTLFPSQ